MPPKPAAPVVSITAPPAPVIIDPAVVAAQKVVERWQRRAEEVAITARKVKESIGQLETQRTARETLCKDLLVKVQQVASPKPPPTPQEVIAATVQVAQKKDAKGKKDAAPAAPAAPPPPAVPQPPDEEELKRQAKLQQALIAVFKKKRDKGAATTSPPVSPHVRNIAAPGADGANAADTTDLASGAALAADGGPMPSLEGLPPKPPEIDAELWLRVLRLRDERIAAEESLVTLRQSIEIATARSKGLMQIEKLVRYSLAAAQLEEKKAVEASDQHRVAAHGAAGLQRKSLAASGVLPAAPPADPKPPSGVRPSSQMMNRR